MRPAFTRWPTFWNRQARHRRRTAPAGRRQGLPGLGAGMGCRMGKTPVSGPEIGAGGMGVNRACGLQYVGKIMFNEEAVKLAFKYSSRLTEADLKELVKRMTADGKDWKRKKYRQESVGEVLDAVQIERGRKSAEKYRRKSKWMKRELSEAEKLQLQSAWGS